MKVVQFADFGGRMPGSFVSALVALRDECTARGWDYSIVLSPIAKDRAWLATLQDTDVRFVKPSLWPHADFRSVLRGADVVHCHFSAFDIGALVWAALHPKVRIYWHVHSVPSFTARGWLKRAVRFRILGRRVTRTIVVGQHVGKLIKRHGARRVTALANGIDTGYFRPPTAEQRRRARQVYGLEDHDFVFLHFGRDRHVKGGDIVEGALEWTPSSVKVLSVGSQEDHSIAAPPRERIVRIPSTDRVVDAYHAADAFLGASRTEGMPYALLEALSCGLPAALTPIPAHKEVDGRVRGCFVAADMSPSALAVAMRDVMARGASPDSIRFDILQEHDVRRWAALVASFYLQDGNSE